MWDKPGKTQSRSGQSGSWNPGAGEALGASPRCSVQSSGRHANRHPLRSQVLGVSPSSSQAIVDHCCLL